MLLFIETLSVLDNEFKQVVIYNVINSPLVKALGLLKLLIPVLVDPFRQISAALKNALNEWF